MYILTHFNHIIKNKQLGSIICICGCKGPGSLMEASNVYNISSAYDILLAPV
jgi:hypothetical protein